jgi:hypothetical protein
MPFVPVANTAHAVVHQRLDNQEVLNNLYFQHVGGPPSSVDLGNLAQGLLDYWTTNMLPFQSAQLTLERVSARDLTAANGLVIEAAAGPGTVGGSSNDFLPNNVAFCISFRTGFAGRSFRGRNYFGGLTEQEVTDNTVNALTVANLVEAYNNMVLVGAVATGWDWVIVSRQSGGVDRPAGVVTPVVTAVATDDRVDSMRTRLPGRGR